MVILAYVVSLIRSNVVSAIMEVLYFTLLVIGVLSPWSFYFNRKDDIIKLIKLKKT